MRATSARTLKAVVPAIALAIGLLSSVPAEAQSKCEKNWPELVVTDQDGLNLTGRLDNEDVRVYLHTGHPARRDDGVSGVVLYPSHWQPGQTDETWAFSLDGLFTDDCQMRLEDSNGGVWQLRRSTGRQVAGTREHPAGLSSAVSLRKISALDCSGRGAWRTFKSPAWPITFDYPASWRLVESGNDILLDCPDARSLALGGQEIWFRRGQGREDSVANNGRRVTRIDGFVSFENNQWLAGDTCEDRPDDLGLSCEVARQSRWRGMTVLQGLTGEHRLYRVGHGYIGQGGGMTRYAFLVGDAWLRIFSHAPPVSIGAAGPGPVVFDGNSVTARIVRSIRRRSF